MKREMLVALRDELNKKIEELLAIGDRDSHVASCCIAVAVEELEKWMYNGQFTPSVIPASAEFKEKVFEEGIPPDPSKRVFEGKPKHPDPISSKQARAIVKRLRKEEIHQTQENDERIKIQMKKYEKIQFPDDVW